MKKILLVLLLFIPMFVFARECDSDLHKEYASFASKITYDNDFSMTKMQFNITFYNVVDGLRFEFDNKTYRPEENEIKINNIS